MCACVHASILSSSTNILYVSIHKYTHTHTYMLNIDTHSRPLVPPQAPIPSPHIPASYYTVAPTDQYFLSVPPPPPPTLPTPHPYYTALPTDTYSQSVGTGRFYRATLSDGYHGERVCLNTCDTSSCHEFVGKSLSQTHL
jgi:hypothetical protein